MSKTRNDAAIVLLKSGWTFEEIEKILVKPTRPKRKVKSVKPN